MVSHIEITYKRWLVQRCETGNIAECHQTEKQVAVKESLRTREEGKATKKRPHPSCAREKPIFSDLKPALKKVRRRINPAQASAGRKPLNRGMERNAQTQASCTTRPSLKHDVQGLCMHKTSTARPHRHSKEMRAVCSVNHMR